MLVEHADFPPPRAMEEKYQFPKRGLEYFLFD
jgi:hypothetical protein